MFASRKVGVGLALSALVAGALILPSSAQASSKGRKNTAIALGAVAAQQLLTGKTTNGVVAGAAAAYAYKRYEDAKKDEKRDPFYRRRSDRDPDLSHRVIRGQRSNSADRNYDRNDNRDVIYGRSDTRNDSSYDQTWSQDSARYDRNGSAGDVFSDGRVVRGRRDQNTEYRTRLTDRRADNARHRRDERRDTHRDSDH